jgi:hypothetical protein
MKDRLKTIEQDLRQIADMLFAKWDIHYLSATPEGKLHLGTFLDVNNNNCVAFTKWKQ